MEWLQRLHNERIPSGFWKINAQKLEVSSHSSHYVFEYHSQCLQAWCESSHFQSRKIKGNYPNINEDIKSNQQIKSQ